MNSEPIMQAPLDFGSLLLEILTHLGRNRRFRRPIRLAAIDQEGQVMLQTLKPTGEGVLLHYPDMTGALAFEATLWPPIHLLFVDRDGRP
jgi:hypothetical protein